MTLVQKKKALFQKAVWDYYAANKRAGLPWRKKITPYRVWVSEIMLQQTQVDRVVGFFDAWMKQFPTVKDLAGASQVDVLKLWKGLGYNSRAIRMKHAAEDVMKNDAGTFPKTLDGILALPGVGPYTAGAIMAFAYNRPVSFIETNIRRVFIHHFFADSANVHDRDIMPLVEETVDVQNPREWYWALMDYGSYLGRTIPNPNKKSRHYSVQKKFEGSDRQIRGRILSIMLETKRISIEHLSSELKDLSDDEARVERILSRLEQEGFFTIADGKISLKK